MKTYFFKNFLFIFVMGLILSTPCFGEGNATFDPFYLKPTKKYMPPVKNDSPKPTYTYIVDRFEDPQYREWWNFGALKLEVVNNGVGEMDPMVQGKALRFQGKTKDYVVGGAGRYLGLDSAQFNAIKMMVKGNAKKGSSGKITVELYVSQDNKWRHPDPAVREYSLKYESQYTYTMAINWKGWKVVTIPFSNFLAGSPRMEKSFWNRAEDVAKGTLIQLQLLVLSTQEKGEVDFQIASLAFIQDKNIQQNIEYLEY